MGDYRLRAATLDDAGEIAYQRWAMFHEMGQVGPADRPALDAAMRRYLAEAMPAGRYRAWLVEVDGRVVAGGGLQLRPLVPRPGHLDGQDEAIVLGMWTEPDHRRRGLARQVLAAILDWARANGLRRLCLHATEAGRPLYAGLGFVPSNEMRVELG